MGYSIAAVLPGTETRDLVLAFLTEHLTPINELLGEPDLYVRGPTDDPSYGNDALKDRSVAFDFSTSSQWQSRVAYRVCYWIVKQIPGSTFYYDYDQQDLPDETDENGFVPMEDFERRQVARSPGMLLYVREDIAELEKLNPIVSGELARLTALWSSMDSSRAP